MFTRGDPGHWLTALLRRMPKYKVCGYLTDVEGNFDYFERYIAASAVLEWDDEKTKTKLKFKRPDAIFVFGGDSQVRRFAGD